MGEIHTHAPVLGILAAFSRHDEALAWALRTAVEDWGPLALASEPFEFTETRFYEATMGAGLHKVFWAFERLLDPAELVARKLQTNGWERSYAEQSAWDEPRPLNLDPGYLTPAKLVLASTKDRDHRLYLAQGVYAENTLYYYHGSWQPRPWTYPDYRRSDYHRFLEQCRDYLRQQPDPRRRAT